MTPSVTIIQSKEDSNKKTEPVPSTTLADNHVISVSVQLIAPGAATQTLTGCAQIGAGKSAVDCGHKAVTLLAFGTPVTPPGTAWYFFQWWVQTISVERDIAVVAKKQVRFIFA